MSELMNEITAPSTPSLQQKTQAEAVKFALALRMFLKDEKLKPLLGGVKHLGALTEDLRTISTDANAPLSHKSAHALEEIGSILRNSQTTHPELSGTHRKAITQLANDAQSLAILRQESKQASAALTASAEETTAAVSTTPEAITVAAPAVTSQAATEKISFLDRLTLRTPKKAAETTSSTGAPTAIETTAPVAAISEATSVAEAPRNMHGNNKQEPSNLIPLSGQASVLLGLLRDSTTIVGKFFQDPSNKELHSKLRNYLRAISTTDGPNLAHTEKAVLGQLKNSAPEELPELMRSAKAALTRLTSEVDGAPTIKLEDLHTHTETDPVKLAFLPKDAANAIKAYNITPQPTKKQDGNGVFSDSIEQPDKKPVSLKLRANLRQEMVVKGERFNNQVNISCNPEAIPEIKTFLEAAEAISTQLTEQARAQGQRSH